MGLTIHYKLHADSCTAAEARRLVEELRTKALDLPFQEVGEVTELKGGSCDYQYYVGNNPLRWLAIQAGQYVEDGDTHYSVKPKHIIAFSSDPGEGCETANFGLCLYPATILVPDPKGRGNRRIQTGLKGWCWGSFCKTQYATRHGVDHFIRCHLSVIRLLDHAKELGILGSVSDEGDYWEKRDVKALALEVGDWNEGVAALVGQLKDLLGDKVEAPITKFPDFEHLEAKGQKPKDK